MAQHYTVKKVIDGVEYTAQFNGNRAAMRAVDSCYIDGSSNLSTEKLTDYLLQNVIVEPKGLDMDDFDDTKTLNAVTAFAREVMEGTFRDKKDKGGTEAGSKA